MPGALIDHWSAIDLLFGRIPGIDAAHPVANMAAWRRWAAVPDRTPGIRMTVAKLHDGQTEHIAEKAVRGDTLPQAAGSRATLDLAQHVFALSRVEFHESVLIQLLCALIDRGKSEAPRLAQSRQFLIA